MQIVLLTIRWIDFYYWWANTWISWYRYDLCGLDSYSISIPVKKCTSVAVWVGFKHRSQSKSLPAGESFGINPECFRFQRNSVLARAWVQFITIKKLDTAGIGYRCSLTPILIETLVIHWIIWFGERVQVCCWLWFTYCNLAPKNVRLGFYQLLQPMLTNFA